MTSISSSLAAHRRNSGGAEGKGAQLRARSRPHLPDAGGADPPCGHSLYLFRSYRSQILDRLRRGRSRHRQLLHGDVLLSVRPVRLARAQRTRRRDYLSAIACFGLGLPFAIAAVHHHPDRVLRHLAAAPSRPRLRGILVEDGHGRPLAERPDLVRLGVAGVRSYGEPAVPALTQAARSDQPAVAARLRPARPVLPVSRLASPRCVLYSGAGLFRTQPLVRVRAVLGAGQPRAALCGLLLHRSRRRRGEFRSRPA